MSRTLYSLLLRLVLPPQALAFWWRGWRHPVYRGSLRAHLAAALESRSDRPLWLHAASAGEVQALAGLLQLLREHHPSLPLLLTVGTPTGLARARELYAAWMRPSAGTATLTVQAAPWDLPGASRRFLAACSPCAGVFVETELWPNLVHAATNRGLPLLLVSARVSARSTARYLRWAPQLMRSTVRAFTSIAAQSEVDRARFVSLGADGAQVRVTGNLKFDLPLPPNVMQQGASLRQLMAPQRAVWVAGSTHEGEENICLAAQRSLRVSAMRAGKPAPLLVLAPRRPERFETVAQWLGAQRVAWARYTAIAGQGVVRAGDAGIDAPLGADIDVLLVDGFGQLLVCYAGADICFVGGTLVPVGGHNLLEPAALGKPVLAGPHCFNAAESARLLEAVGGLRRVDDEPQLLQALRDWLDDPAAAAQAGGAAAAAVIANRGAAAQVLREITALLASASDSSTPALV